MSVAAVRLLQGPAVRVAAVGRKTLTDSLAGAVSARVGGRRLGSSGGW